MKVPRSYLFVTCEGGGNVPPVLGVARRLVARGHTVRALAERCLREPVAEIGARLIPFSRHFTREDRTEDLTGDWKPKSPVAALKCLYDGVIFGPARIVAEETRSAIVAERPDVVVVDALMPGALIAAEASDLPRVVLFHSPEFLPGPGKPAAGPGFLPRQDLLGRVRDVLFDRLSRRVLKPYLPPWNDTRRAFGLPALDKPQDLINEYHRADLRLIQTSEAFDFPITPAPPNVRYVGPVLDEPDWAGTWENPWPEPDPRPLVVVGLSSTFQNQGDTLRRIVAALGTLGVRGLVTLGPAMAGESFETPENVVAVATAPHGRVFPSADAVVTHAGHGTVIRALSHGLPLLCLPMGRDQDDNAARVVAREVGLRLKRSARPQKIAAALRRLLDESRYRTNAARLGQIIAKDVAVDRAVAELEAVGA